MFVQRHTFRTHHHNLQHTSSATVCKSPGVGTHDKRTNYSTSDYLTTSKEKRDKRGYDSSKIIANSTERRAVASKHHLKLSRQTQSNIETSTQNSTHHHHQQHHQHLQYSIATRVSSKASSTPSSFRLPSSKESSTGLVQTCHVVGKSFRLRRSNSLSTRPNKPKLSAWISCDYLLLDLLRTNSRNKSRVLVEQSKNNEVPKRNCQLKREGAKRSLSYNESRRKIDHVKRINSVDKILGNISQLLELVGRLWYLSYFCLDFVTYQLETWRLLADSKAIAHQEITCCQNSNSKSFDNSDFTTERATEIQNIRNHKQKASTSSLNQDFSKYELYSDNQVGNKNSKMVDCYFPEHYGYTQRPHPLQPIVRSRDEHLSSSIIPRVLMHDPTMTRAHLEFNSTPSTSQFNQRTGLFYRSRIRERTVDHDIPVMNSKIRQNNYDFMAADINQMRSSVGQSKPAQSCRITNNAQQVTDTPSLEQHSISNSFEYYLEEPQCTSLPLTCDQNSHNTYQARSELRAGVFAPQHSVDGSMNGGHYLNRSVYPSHRRPISSISQHKSKLQEPHIISNCKKTFEKNLKVGSDSELYLSNPTTNSRNNNKSKLPSFAARLMNHTSLDYSSKVLGHSETASVSTTCKGPIRHLDKSQDSSSSSCKKNNSSKLSLLGAKKRLGFKKNGLNALSVQRSEEVIPLDTNLSFSDSITEDSSLWSSQVQWQSAYDNLGSFFVEGLGPGQIASRQALVSPYLGDIQLTLSDRRGMLEVEVVRARRLQAKFGTKNLPSPYVKVYLMKNKKCIAKWKTSQARQTLDPLYQQLFIFREEYSNCVVQVIVWGDYGKKDKKSLMGAVQINIDELDISNLVIGWYRLLNAPSMVNSLHSSKALRQMMLAKQV